MGRATFQVPGGWSRPGAAWEVEEKQSRGKCGTPGTEGLCHIRGPAWVVSAQDVWRQARPVCSVGSKWRNHSLKQPEGLTRENVRPQSSAHQLWEVQWVQNPGHLKASHTCLGKEGKVLWTDTPQGLSVCTGTRGIQHFQLSKHCLVMGGGGSAGEAVQHSDPRARQSGGPRLCGPATWRKPKYWGDCIKEWTD